MLKINLLPSYIQTRRQVKIAAGAVTVILIAEVAVGIYMMQAPQKTKAELAAKKADVEGQLTKLRAVESASGGVLAAEGALAPKYDFITHMLDYNTAYPTLYARTARYTYANAMLTNLSATSNTLKFDAYVSNPSDVSVLMRGLMRNADFQGLPQISGVPGYDAKEQSAREKAGASDVAPTMIVGGVSGAAGGAPGPGGGNSPGGAPGMPGGAPGMPGGAPGMPGGNGPGGAPMSSPPGAPGMPGGGNGPGGAGGGGGGTGDLSKLVLEAARIKPTGFIINVTCALSKPITRPPYGTADTQAGSGGGGSSSGGGMGMGNMPGGMPGGAPGMNGPGGGRR